MRRGTYDPSVGIFPSVASFEVGEYPDDPLYREQVREAAHALFSLLSDDERAACAVFGDECGGVAPGWSGRRARVGGASRGQRALVGALAKGRQP